MKFTGVVIAHEDTGYQGKRGFVPQQTMTCIDAEASCKLKDTVDCVSADPLLKGAEMVGKTVTFDVDGIRQSQSGRPRFMVKAVTVAGTGK